MAGGGHPHQEIAAKSESLVKAFNVDTDILSFEETSTLYKNTRFTDYSFLTEEEALHFINAIPNTELYTSAVAAESPRKKA